MKNLMIRTEQMVPQIYLAQMAILRTIQSTKMTLLKLIQKLLMRLDYSKMITVQSESNLTPLVQ